MQCHNKPRLEGDPCWESSDCNEGLTCEGAQPNTIPDSNINLGIPGKCQAQALGDSCTSSESCSSGLSCSPVDKKVGVII
jgi:hypothetical protein